jgi:L-serine dehydratase
MNLSVLDLFTIGIGPSSSHTVGPMRAGQRFVTHLRDVGLLDEVAHVQAHLYGSLALTGKGHGTDKAVFMGLEGETPEKILIDQVECRLTRIRTTGILNLGGTHPIPFQESKHLIFHTQECLPYHPNGLRFVALDTEGNELLAINYYSIGGGFVVDEDDACHDKLTSSRPTPPYPFKSSAQMIELCQQHGWKISDLMLQNEATFRPEAETRARLLKIWKAMQACIDRGCTQEGILPGILKVRRRAPKLFRDLSSRTELNPNDPLMALDWLSLWAMAVNEENAAGGRVVTAPTNGAAGIIPAVLNFLVTILKEDSEETIVRYLLTAGAIGMLYKMNASISGAEVGCQGEVGVACSMAAAALCEAQGGTCEQVENAAEIGMEHHLGMTCDPIGGLVQIPCIERNAMGSAKAVNAARLALRGDGTHKVSLDKVIATMRQTGMDMSTKYKETSQGGLAVNITEC